MRVDRSDLLTKLSPLKTRGLGSAHAPSRPPDPPRDPEPPEREGRLLPKVFAGVGLALTATGIVMGINVNANMGPPPFDQVLSQGFSGDALLTRRETAQNLLQYVNQINGGETFTPRDLQRVAIDENAPEELRTAAQEALSDPLLLSSMDVAAGSCIDNRISTRDLEQFLANEPSAELFTFTGLAHGLNGSVAEQTGFDFFDSNNDGLFTRSEVQTVANNQQAPEPFRDLARGFLENGNLYNGFDIASQDYSRNLLDLFSRDSCKDGRVSTDDVQHVIYTPTPESGAQWTPEDVKALRKIANGDGLSSEFFESFHQTDRGNCVSTAVIKLAMDRYGYNVVRDFQATADGGYTVTMQDGYQVHLTAQEMEQAATAAHFQGGSRETRAYAVLLFGSMAKRAQAMEHQGAWTYAHALKTLNDGEQTVRAPEYLGLQAQVRRIRPSEVAQSDGAIVYGGGHAYYVDNVNGQVVGDKWGTPTPWGQRARVDEGEVQKGALTFQRP